MKKFERNAQMNFMIKFLWVHLVVLHSIGKKGEGTKSWAASRSSEGKYRLLLYML